MIEQSDTIFGLSSGAGRAGVAVVRVSGPAVANVCKAMCGLEKPTPRRALLRDIHAGDGGVIDRGLVLFFPGPDSFTGEDVTEFQVHGSLAVLAAIFETLSEIEGVRAAEAGEFTRRAFENGKLDLTEVEGLWDLIEAETEAQRKQAFRQMRGDLGELYEGWRRSLLESLAYIEADFDFPDEELPDDLLSGRVGAIVMVTEAIRKHLDSGNDGERLRKGFQVAIVGAPNAGKSSLLNYLAKRDVAIVSEEAGTTRDVVEVHLDLAGLPVTVADTAGIRECAGAVETEGIRRARERAAAADLRVILANAADYPDVGLDDDLVQKGDVVLWNKADLLLDDVISQIPISEPGFLISILQDSGLDSFLNYLKKVVSESISTGETPEMTRNRYRVALMETHTHLECVLEGISKGMDVVLLAEELRLAARSIGRITGRVDVEDLLDVIFSEFCIGK